MDDFIKPILSITLIIFNASINSNLTHSCRTNNVTIELPMIRDMATLVWRHRNGNRNDENTEPWRTHRNISRWMFNTLRLRQNGRHLPDDIFKCILLNENVWITTKNSLKFVPKGRINNIPSLLQIMDWRRPGDKPLCEPMMVNSLTHICITRPQWVK